MKKVLSVILGLLMTLAILAPALAGCSAKTTPTWENVEAGKVTPQEYFNYLPKTLPELKLAEEQGLIKGILYDPSTSELHSKLTELLKGQPDAEQLVESNLNANAVPIEGEVFNVMPTNLELVGKRLPEFIVVHPFALSYIKNDNEVADGIIHEIQHATDFYNGVRLGEHVINWQSFAKNEVGMTFWKNLLELRAYHKQLYSIISKVQQNKNKNVYDFNYVATTAGHYVDYYQALPASANTSEEIDLAEYQLAAFADISPTVGDGQVKIKTLVDGIKGEMTMGFTPNQ